eukprot:CAMPEP_0174261922 /NCGR_PEP_ID=MMETSP0439-20130205/12666_1 /TAXON_ID=0 /ORGANISM="Stereomyxa ramosa, Strain Chinc5" /LENGTH=424 /DNA_ID=CAMNT_0015346531 /DNA_START=362 /DNA_END=1633 /DNA_ORIENTATION=-
MKVLLGVVWRLILTFQVDTTTDEETAGMTAAQKNRAAKQKLLAWCQEMTKDYDNVDIQDFGPSWYDGMGFLALVNQLDPECLNYSDFDPSNAKTNLDTAFDIAENKFDIFSILDSEDIVNEDPLSRPDEQCFMTYLSAFHVAAMGKDMKAAVTKEKAEVTEEERRAIEEEARKRAEEEAEKKIREAAERARKEAEEAAAKQKAEDEKRRKEEQERLREEEQKKIDAAKAAARSEAEKEALEKLEEENRRRQMSEEKRRKEEEEEESRRAAEEEQRERAFEEERRRLQEENEKLKASLRAARDKLIGQLGVTVVEARGLKSKANAYCALFLERQKERTKTCKKTKKPRWRADFDFYVSEKDASLEVTVFDHRWLLADDFIGYVNIPMTDLIDGEEAEGWYPLKARKKDEKSSGELKLKLIYRREN